MTHVDYFTALEENLLELWPQLSSTHRAPLLFSSVFLLPSSPPTHIKTFVIGFRPHQDPGPSRLEILNSTFKEPFPDTMTVTHFLSTSLVGPIQLITRVKNNRTNKI